MIDSKVLIFFYFPQILSLLHKGPDCLELIILKITGKIFLVIYNVLFQKVVNFLLFICQNNKQKLRIIDCKRQEKNNIRLLSIINIDDQDVKKLNSWFMVLVHFVRIGEKIINWTLSWNYWFSEQNHSLYLGILWFVLGKSTFHGFFYNHICICIQASIINVMEEKDISFSRLGPGLDFFRLN